MKKTIKLAVVAALALGATSAFATNGSTMIGAGAKTRGMAGIGIAMSHGAESVLVNPALITKVENNEVSFGGTVFMPDVESTNSISAAPGTTATSEADFFVIPSVSVVTKVNDNFYTGVGMWGTGGLGVDYRNTADSSTTGTGQMQMVTSLQLMQFGVPLAYKMDNFSIAITPLIQYGTLDINYALPTGPGTSMNVGTGIGSDIEIGYNVGLTYTADALTFGLVYKSEIEMNYDGALLGAVSGMNPGYTNDTLSTPSELGVGISYAMGNHTFAVDYKTINWADADGYKDFGWEDQNVIALGYEYAAKTWAVRAGYSKSDSAVQDNAGKNLALDIGQPTPGALTNTFNTIGFPGNIEEHYALGATFNASKTVSFDLAYVYAPENTTTVKNFAVQDSTVKHSETSYSLQANLAF